MMTIFLKLSLLAAAIASPAWAEPPSKDYELLFADEFDGAAVNTAHWRYREDVRKGGYFNGLILKQNVSVSGGKLRIAARLEKIVWDSPSSDAWESMPLSGRLGAGANVWVQDDSLWLYLAHNEANDEDGRLLKLGALRITPPSTLPLHARLQPWRKAATLRRPGPELVAEAVRSMSGDLIFIKGALPCGRRHA